MTSSNGTFTTIFGAQAPDTLTINGHVWTADPTTQLYTLSLPTGAGAPDLATEWKSDYSALLNKQPLNLIQHLEANAESVFENTGLSKLPAATQERDREDLQREFDAIYQAIVDYNATASAGSQIDLNKPLTDQEYLAIGQEIQSTPGLEELAIQGHGLNNSGLARYNGYTNDFQNGVDGSTLYIGGGLDNNQNALTDFVDDVVLSHLPFPTVYKNGALEQLNQNGDAEDQLANSVGAFDAAATTMTLTAADFSATPGTASSTPQALPASDTTPAPSGERYSLTGFLIPTTITENGHVWTADSSGLYTTTANLASEWQSAYQTMLAGKGSTLTAAQFLEGNAEAVFENTGLAKVGATDATQLDYDRMDVQREIDAIVGALQAAGINPNQQLTVATWQQMEHALQDSPALEELAVQGHGVNDPTSPIYNGYTNDFQNNVDNKTLYVGAGNDSGERAIADLFDDSIMTHAPFPTIVENGELEQLNQNGDNESTAQLQVDEYNQFRFNQVLKASDFNVPGNPIGAQPTNTTTTVFGATVPSTITVNGDVWTIGSDGKYHLPAGTNLQALWEGYYQQMLAGNGSSLTAVQRMEGNAEAVFDNTGLSNLKRYNAAKQESFREDAAREFDAIGAAMTQLGLGATLLNEQDYLNIGQAIQSNASWEELAIQGHGLNSAPSGKYSGYTDDFQNNSDNSTYFVGGGIDNGEKAITDFFDDVIMTHLPFPVVSENGALEQLNQNGNREDTIATVVEATNEAMFTRVFVASDFSANQNATGAVVYVSPEMATARPPASPTAGAGQILSLSGEPIPATQTVNGHVWTADSNGLYETNSDLTLEWWNSYQAAQAGKPLTLTQKWEAQAETVFLSTGLANVSEGQQEIDRMDAQREIDAVVTVMNQLGLGAAPLTAANYLAIGHALQDNAALEQLAVEGHGLNDPYVAGATEYNGYTNDFQHNVDNRTLYVGPGPDNGERAIADFFDDDIMTHLPFPVVMQNGELTQLNQNGNGESTLNEAVEQVNDTLFGKLLISANFEVPGYNAPSTPKPTPPATITGYYGDTLPGTIIENGHTWVADSTGTYQTSANLEIEWRTDYQMLLNGQGGQMTATQRLEGNMEAFLENSNINTMWNGAAQEEQMRVDLQRGIDAIAGAMKIDQASYNIDPNAEFTEATFLQLGDTIRGNAQLEELSLQGVGMVDPSSAQYRGAYKDIFSGADWSTYFVGGGADNGKLAVAYAMGDMLGNLPFATTDVNGAWMTTNSNGMVGESTLTAAALMNQAMYRQVFTSSDFSKAATAAGAVKLIAGAPSAAVTPVTAVTPQAGKIVTLDGAQIASSFTVDGHNWTADSSGLFHTANLAAEWQNDYSILLKGGSLTAIQHAEADAEAVLEATGVTNLSAAQQQKIREDVQRQLDAEAGAMPSLTVPGSPQLTPQSYLEMTRALQSNNALEELALQGHGVTGANQARYGGIIADTAGLSQVKYVGGGLNNGGYALGAFLQQDIMGDAPFAATRQNGRLVQLDQTGQPVLQISAEVTALDNTLWNKTYTKASFHA